MKPTFATRKESQPILRRKAFELRSGYKTIGPRLIVAVALCAELLVFSKSYGASRDICYLRQSSLVVGGLSMSKVSVSSVSLTNNSTVDCLGTATDDVQELKVLGPGQIVAALQRSGSESSLSGTLTPGTSENPGALMSGTFHWVNGKLVEIDNLRLKLRLNRLSLGTPILGGHLGTSSEDVGTLEGNSLTLSGGRSSGKIVAAIPKAKLISAKIEWADIHGTIDLVGSQIQIEGNLATDEPLLSSGTFTADKWISDTPGAPIFRFFENHTVGIAQTDFQGVRIALDGETGKMNSSSAYISHPALSYLPRKDIKVAAALEIRIDNPQSSNCKSGMESLICAAPESPQLSVKPDQRQIVERLLRFTLIEPADYLLPTGMVGIKYMTVSALHQLFYSDLWSPGPVAGVNPVSTPGPSHTPSPATKPQIGAIISVRDDGVAVSLEDEERKRLKLHFDPNDPGIKLVTAIAAPGGPIAESVETLTVAAEKMIFGSETSLVGNASEVAPWFVQKAIQAGNSVLKSLPKVAGQLVDEYSQEKAGELGDSLRDLDSKYKGLALPGIFSHTTGAVLWHGWQRGVSSRFDFSQKSLQQQTQAARQRQDAENAAISNIAAGGGAKPVSGPSPGGGANTIPPSQGGGTNRGGTQPGDSGSSSSSDCNTQSKDGGKLCFDVQHATTNQIESVYQPPAARLFSRIGDVSQSLQDAAVALGAVASNQLLEQDIRIFNNSNNPIVLDAFSSGSEVLALWKDSNDFPSTRITILPNAERILNVRLLTIAKESTVASITFMEQWSEIGHLELFYFPVSLGTTDAPAIQNWSFGPYDSGNGQDWSPWYEFCTAPAPLGYELAAPIGHLWAILPEFATDPRGCTQWAVCSEPFKGVDGQGVCYGARVQGHYEKSSGSRIVKFNFGIKVDVIPSKPTWALTSRVSLFTGR